MLKAGQAMGIVTASIDRLSRSTVDFGRTLQRAQHEGWSVVCLDINLHMTTATGRMVANVVAAIAQWESERIGERTSAALRAAETRGVKLGRPRTLSDELRARVVSERASGSTLQAIADALNAEGMPTARGGSQWQRGTVKAVIDSAVRGSLRRPPTTSEPIRR